MTSVITHQASAKFFIDFLSEHGSDELVRKWNDEDNQEAFKALVTKKTKRSSEKKPTDPNKPKRSTTAYLVFCKEMRPRAKKELGDDVKATDVTKRLGEMWTALKASTKSSDKKALERYQQEAADDKERFDQEMLEYQPPSDDEIVTAKKTRKSSPKDPNEPKKPPTAYIIFCRDARALAKKELGDDAKPVDITRRIGEMWTELKADSERVDELEEYKKQADKEKALYQIALEKYKAGEDVEVAQEQVTKKEEKPKKAKKEEKPKEVKPEKTKKTKLKKSKISGFTYFCDTERPDLVEENEEMGEDEVEAELLRRWKDMDEETQASWEEEAAAL
jgi:hypothetical protein